MTAVSGLTFPPPIPMPQLLSFSTLKVWQEGLFRSCSIPFTPSGPKALSLRSNSVSLAPALINALPRDLWWKHRQRTREAVRLREWTSKKHIIPHKSQNKHHTTSPERPMNRTKQWQQFSPGLLGFPSATFQWTCRSNSIAEKTQKVSNRNSVVCPLCYNNGQKEFESSCFGYLHLQIHLRSILLLSKKKYGIHKTIIWVRRFNVKTFIDTGIKQLRVIPCSSEKEFKLVHCTC